MPGRLRISGFTSKPELQKLNRNSIYCFVNRRLVRDRLLMHAVSEAYRNILPPTSFPVVLLFVEMPPEEVDVNVHPAKTEVRFRQPTWLHDFVRDTLRHKLTLGKPAAGFLQALTSHPSAAPALIPDSGTPSSGGWFSGGPVDREQELEQETAVFTLTPSPGVLPFAPSEPVLVPQHANGLAIGLANGQAAYPSAYSGFAGNGARPSSCSSATLDVLADEGSDSPSLHGLAALRPLGQLRDSFILAVNQEGLWIIDQHVAHERILFERVMRERHVEQVQRQRLLMPMLVDLLPAQMVAFAGIARELEANGFEVEPFGPRTIAIKAAPVGLEGAELERMLVEVLEQAGSLEQAENLAAARARIAASIACHAAIKINTPLDPARMEWLLAELAKTEHPTSCPHGRPIVLRYAWKDIQRAFHRI
jgi:DNA mismatch repair protein MutL